ncbi:hypothetical protein Val02_50760 [Virgisporangium aliadipatigenens]|uniref:DUF8175 domain-containing protein n=1 Tax=Virgisporangium aliadipatigenens TaxID=741659 RepID=A0A8J4DRI5_9ACTN|nr:hypothetical protein [Virgisporangium aliadipatigenens]GIJ48190.1 hypothetical protein Val02_50760 [Virgisporangium aliadipatigenens]
MLFVRRRRAHDEEPDTPFWQQGGWVLSAGFFVMVILMATVAWFARDDRSAAPPAPDTVTEPLAAAVKLRGDARPQGCRTAATDSVVPTEQPGDVQWRDLFGGRVPVSTGAGPTRTEGALMWCYAHNPTGAVLAAHVIPAQMSGTEWRKAAELQLAPGRSRDVFIRMRGTVPDRPVRQGTAGTFVGFDVVAYTPDAATVQLLIQGAQAAGTGGGYMSTEIALRWTGGDWKVLPRDDGALYTPMNAETRAAGYVMWKG